MLLFHYHFAVLAVGNINIVIVTTIWLNIAMKSEKKKKI